MSSDRLTRRFAMLSLMGLAGCGFAPIYATSTGLRGQMAFSSDETVVGFRLRERLEERMGRADAPAFTLTTSSRIRQRQAAITADAQTARFNVVGSADWVLRNALTGGRVDGGTVDAFTSYSATGSTIATQAARDDAEARLAVILADLIVSRLLLIDTDARA